MQRDYILRMIEQMALVIARLRHRILQGERAAASELQAEAARQGVNLDLARALDEESLLMLLSPGGAPEPARCWVMAELLYLDGLQSEAAGRTDAALHTYTRALRLFLALDPSIIGGIPEASDRITELEGRIGRLTGEPDPSTT